jgi:hypothetical protein
VESEAFTFMVHEANFLPTKFKPNNEPLGAKGAPLVGEEACKEDVGKVRS